MLTFVALIMYICYMFNNKLTGDKY